MEKEKLKVNEHEANLLNEEKILEGIRDSLKGEILLLSFISGGLIRIV
jgi:hypothetical protein